MNSSAVRYASSKDPHLILTEAAFPEVKSAPNLQFAQ